MNSKQVGYEISLLEFKLKVLTDKIPEVYIVGSGKVARVITENNNIYLIGEEAANDTYLRGYKDGMDAMQKFQEGLFKNIEEEILHNKRDPDWNFKTDYHGEFKKKGEGEND